MRYRQPWSKGRVSSWSKALPSKPKRLLCGTLCQFCCFCLHCYWKPSEHLDQVTDGDLVQQRPGTKSLKEKMQNFFLIPASIINRWLFCNWFCWRGYLSVSQYCHHLKVFWVRQVNCSLAFIMDLNISNHILYFYKHIINISNAFILYISINI